MPRIVTNDEEQREHAEERVVRDRRGEPAAVVLAEALGHGERQRRATRWRCWKPIEAVAAAPSGDASFTAGSASSLCTTCATGQTAVRGDVAVRRSFDRCKQQGTVRAMTRGGRDRTFGATEQGTVAVLANECIDLDVPARPDEVAGARHAVVDYLTSRGVSSVVVDDIELVTSELVTNAIIHPAGRRAASSSTSSVDVSDASSSRVSNVGPADGDPAGRASGSRRRRSRCPVGASASSGGCATTSPSSSAATSGRDVPRRLPDGGAKP